MPNQHETVEGVVRARLRERRIELGWSLEELAERTLINPSTLSRLETGGRRIGLDQLGPIAAALGLSLDELVRPAPTEDIVIRPDPAVVDGMTVWHLDPARRPGLPSVMKIRLPAKRRRPDPRSHAGREWIYVLDGTLRLVLGDTEHRVPAHETIAFDTNAAHWHGTFGSPVELLVIFDDHAQRSHLQ